MAPPIYFLVFRNLPSLFSISSTLGSFEGVIASHGTAFEVFFT